MEEKPHVASLYYTTQSTIHHTTNNNSTYSKNPTGARTPISFFGSIADSRVVVKDLLLTASECTNAAAEAVIDERTRAITRRMERNMVTVVVVMVSVV